MRISHAEGTAAMTTPEYRDPSCASLTYESDGARAFRLAAKETEFEPWFEYLCDDIPCGGKLTGADLKTIARFCWEAGRKAPPSTMTDMTRAAWRLSDEDQWWPLEHGGATIRSAMPASPLRCYGCGRTESDDVQFGAMIPMRHAESGADWTLFLCDDCWADAAIESNLKSLWDTIPQP